MKCLKALLGFVVVVALGVGMGYAEDNHFENNTPRPVYSNSIN